MSGIIISFNRMSIRSKLITIFSIIFTVGFVFNFIIASNKLRDETIRRWRRWPTSWRRIDYQEVSAPRIGNSGRAALFLPYTESTPLPGNDQPSLAFHLHHD